MRQLVWIGLLALAACGGESGDGNGKGPGGTGPGTGTGTGTGTATGTGTGTGTGAVDLAPPPIWVEWSDESTWGVFALHDDGEVSLSSGVQLYPWGNVMPSYDGEYVAFIDDPGENLYVASAWDDTTPAPAHTSTGMSGVFWSPDSTKVAVSCGYGCVGQLQILDVASGTVTDVGLHDSGEADPAWSLDGSQLAYVRDEGGEFRAVVVAADGSSEEVLPSVGDVYEVFWGPNGEVAWAGDTLMVRSSGGDVDLGSARVEQWSPDGSLLAWSAGGEVYVGDADGTNGVAVGPGYDVVWSPDSTRLITHTTSSMSVAPADGSSSALELSTDLYGKIRWSPDGSRIAYESDSETSWQGDLWISDLTGPGTRVSPDREPNTYMGGNFHWTDDGAVAVAIQAAGTGWASVVEVVDPSAPPPPPDVPDAIDEDQSWTDTTERQELQELQDTLGADGWQLNHEHKWHTVYVLVFSDPVDSQRKLICRVVFGDDTDAAQRSMTMRCTEASDTITPVEFQGMLYTSMRQFGGSSTHFIAQRVEEGLVGYSY